MLSFSPISGLPISTAEAPATSNIVLLYARMAGAFQKRSSITTFIFRTYTTTVPSFFRTTNVPRVPQDDF